MNTNDTTANTAKKGIRQPIAILFRDDTWNDWFGLRGLYVTSTNVPGTGWPAEDASEFAGKQCPVGVRELIGREVATAIPRAAGPIDPSSHTSGDNGLGLAPAVNQSMAPGLPNNADK